MIPALISAGASLLGGLFGKSASDEAAAKNAALQKEFAQNSLQWKAEDARKAGIHPLYAMGASGYSASPSYVGDTSLPSAMASAGQDISRAIDATRDPASRVGAFTKTMQDLQLTRMGLENELLASQIAKVRQAGHPPGIPSLDGVTPPGAATATKMGGLTVQPDTGWSDAQDIQNRYGEPAEWLYFPFVAGADAIRNIAPSIRASIERSLKNPSPWVGGKGGLVKRNP